MKTNYFFFDIFPRDIAIPNSYHKGSFYRKQVTCVRDFNRYLILMEGNSIGTYTSIYDTSDSPLIDKVIFDLDSNDLEKAFMDVNLLSSRLSKLNIPYSIVFSGKKGFHLYILFKPIKQAREISAYYIGKFQRGIINGLKTVDLHLIGNISGMIRIPNTLNGSRYCVPLPLEFKKMTIEDIFNWSRTKHSMAFSDGNLKPINEFVGKFIEKEKKVDNNCIDKIEVKSVPSLDILQDLIRPCIFNEIKTSKPCNMVRIDFVSELMFMGFTPKQILDIIVNLNWEDYSESMTKYQIRKVFEKRLKPYGCVKLKQNMKCIECNHYYWW